MLMLGNLMKESGVVDRINKTAGNELMNIITIFLGVSVGCTTNAETFLNKNTLFIVALGLIAFCFGTAGGVLFGKIMCWATHGKVNPLIGSAGVSGISGSLGSVGVVGISGSLGSTGVPSSVTRSPVVGSTFCPVVTSFRNLSVSSFTSLR